MNNKHLVVIAGPTASGKTEIGIFLAQKLHTEILSADSRQFYRELNIGTAKPDEAELKLAPHHFINSLFITEKYSAGQYEQDVLKLSDKIFEEKDVALMVGGSGLFIKAACEGFDEIPDVSSTFREQVVKMYAEGGINILRETLKTKDPEYYETVDKHNPQRLMRALEVIFATGKPFSAFRAKNIKERNFRIHKIALGLPRERLYERINLRVDKMMEAGLLEEARQLHHLKNLNPLQTVGYAELFDYLEGKQSLENAVELIKRNTRRYAKRQMTWFRADPEFKWLEAENREEILNYVIQVTT